MEFYKFCIVVLVLVASIYPFPRKLVLDETAPKTTPSSRSSSFIVVVVAESHRLFLPPQLDCRGRVLLSKRCLFSTVQFHIHLTAHPHLVAGQRCVALYAWQLLRSNTRWSILLKGNLDNDSIERRKCLFHFLLWRNSTKATGLKIIGPKSNKNALYCVFNNAGALSNWLLRCYKSIILRNVRMLLQGCNRLPSYHYYKNEM